MNLLSASRSHLTQDNIPEIDLWSNSVGERISGESGALLILPLELDFRVRFPLWYLLHSLSVYQNSAQPYIYFYAIDDGLLMTMPSHSPLRLSHELISRQAQSQSAYGDARKHSETQRGLRSEARDNSDPHVQRKTVSTCEKQRTGMAEDMGFLTNMNDARGGTLNFTFTFTSPYILAAAMQRSHLAVSGRLLKTASHSSHASCLLYSHISTAWLEAEDLERGRWTRTLPGCCQRVNSHARRSVVRRREGAIDPKSATPISEQLHARLLETELYAILNELDMINPRVNAAAGQAQHNVQVGLVNVAERVRLGRCVRLREEMRVQRRLYAITLRDSNCCDVDIVYRRNEYEPEPMRADVDALQIRSARIYHVCPWDARRREMKFSTIVLRAHLDELFPDMRCVQHDIRIIHNTIAAPLALESTPQEAQVANTKPYPRDNVLPWQLRDLDSWWEEDLNKRREQLQPFITWDAATRYGDNSSQNHEHRSLAQGLSIRPATPCPRAAPLSRTLFTESTEERLAHYRRLCEQGDQQDEVSSAWDKVAEANVLCHKIQALAEIIEQGPTEAYSSAVKQMELEIGKRNVLLPSLHRAMNQLTFRALVLNSKPEAEVLAAIGDIHAKLVVAETTVHESEHDGEDQSMVSNELEGTTVSE
nr:hypothetical protein CFP56_09878 [Quercus suber]